MLSTQSYKRAAWRQDRLQLLDPAILSSENKHGMRFHLSDHKYCRPSALKTLTYRLARAAYVFLHRANTEGSAPYKLSARAFTNSGCTNWVLCDARGRTVRQNRTRLSKPAALRYAGEDKKLNAELSRRFISFDSSKRGRVET